MKGVANTSVLEHSAEIAFMNPTGTIEKQRVGPEIMSRSSREADFEWKLFPGEGLIEGDYEWAMVALFSKLENHGYHAGSEYAGIWTHCFLD